MSDLYAYKFLFQTRLPDLARKGNIGAQDIALTFKTWDCWMGWITFRVEGENPSYGKFSTLARAGWKDRAYAGGKQRELFWIAWGSCGLSP